MNDVLPGAAATPLRGTAAQPLRLLSVNINGLNDGQKRRDFLKLVAAGGWDIALVQETHCASEASARSWLEPPAPTGSGERPWKGQAFWSYSGDARSRGVATLVRPGAPVTDVKVGYCDDVGRLLRVDFTYAGEGFAVTNVYAPADADTRVAFLRDVLPRACSDSAWNVVAGDLNYVVREDEHVSRGVDPIQRLRGGGRTAGLHAVTRPGGCGKDA